MPINEVEFVLQAQRVDVGEAVLTKQQLSISARAPFLWGLAEISDEDEFWDFVATIPGYTEFEEEGHTLRAIALTAPQAGVALIGFTVDRRYEAGPEARFFVLDSADPTTANPVEITGDVVISFGGKPVVPLFPAAPPCPYGVTHMVPAEQLPVRAEELDSFEQEIEDSLTALATEVRGPIKLLSDTAWNKMAMAGDRAGDGTPLVWTKPNSVPAGGPGNVSLRYPKQLMLTVSRKTGTSSYNIVADAIEIVAGQLPWQGEYHIFSSKLTGTYSAGQTTYDTLRQATFKLDADASSTGTLKVAVAVVDVALATGQATKVLCTPNGVTMTYNSQYRTYSSGDFELDGQTYRVSLEVCGQDADEYN